MLTLKPFFRRIMVGRWCGLLLPPRPGGLYFHFALGIRSRTLAHMLDSLVRVSRRVDEKHFVSVPRRHDRGLAFSHDKPRKRDQSYLEPSMTKHCFPSVPFQQLQVLFHSLFKVLFIFPSRYLFAIGLLPIFSFRWNLPPN
jgi:hypothetical protein